MYKFFTIPIYLLLLTSGLFTSQAYAAINVRVQFTPANVLPNQTSQLQFDCHGGTDLELDTFPTVCPWNVTQVLDDGFWPFDVS